MNVDNDAKIDRWHDGYFAHRRGEPRPAEPDAGEGWDHRANETWVEVVMPNRPEGYYHCAPGTFEDLGEPDDDFDDSYPPPCTNRRGHSWVYRDDDEEISYCEHCGADGNA